MHVSATGNLIAYSTCENGEICDGYNDKGHYADPDPPSGRPFRLKASSLDLCNKWWAEKRRDAAVSKTVLTASHRVSTAIATATHTPWSGAQCDENSHGELCATCKPGTAKVGGICVECLVRDPSFSKANH